MRRNIILPRRSVHFQDDDYDELRMKMLANFVCGLIDLPIFIIGLFSLLLPTRTIFFFQLFSNHKWNDPDWWHQYNTLRVALCLNFVLGFLDIFALFLGILSLPFPTRTIFFFKMLSIHWPNYLKDDYMELRIRMASNLLWGIIDIIPLICGTLSVVLPTRTIYLYRALKDHKGDYMVCFVDDISISIIDNI